MYPCELPALILQNSAVYPHSILHISYHSHNKVIIFQNSMYWWSCNGTVAFFTVG